MTTEHSAYTDYHPRWRRQQVSTYWWLEKRSYFAFIVREASCLFVAWFVVYLLVLIRAIGQGPAAYQQFLDWSARPSLVLLNLISLIFIVYHTVTFFQAAPQALVVHIGRRRVAGRLVGAAHYGGLLAASALVFWLLVGGSR